MGTTLRHLTSVPPVRGTSPANPITALVQRWTRLRVGPVHPSADDWPETGAAAWFDDRGNSSAAGAAQGGRRRQ